MTASPRRHLLPRRAWRVLARPEGAAVPLGMLLSVARPAYAGPSWASAVDYLLSAPAEAETVQLIAEDLLSGRGQREPVRIHRPWRHHVVGNGMHRIAAHVITAAPTILVSTAPSVPDQEFIQITADLDLPAAHHARDQRWQVWAAMRSFPLGDTWVEACGTSSVNGVFDSLWACPHDLRDQLLDQLRTRAAAQDAELRLRTVTLTRPADWD